MDTLEVGQAAPSSSPSVIRAARILEFLAEPGRQAGVRETARTLGIDKTTTLRILRALEATGFVERVDGTSQYTLGHKSLRLGMAYLKGLDLRVKALPYMQHLRDLTQESVGLNVRAGDERMYVELVESPFELKVKPEVFRPYPLYSGAPGRLLLAHLPPEEIAAILSRVPLVKLTPHTLVDQQLAELLEKTRRDGYTIAIEETIPGVATIAAPVRDHRGLVIAALSILGPVSRFGVRRMLSYKDVLLSHARNLSRELGWAPPTGGGPKDKERRRRERAGHLNERVGRQEDAAGL